jgi:hypothetical protein
VWNQKIWLDSKARAAWQLQSLLRLTLKNPRPDQRPHFMSAVTLKSLHNNLKLL